MGSFQKTKWKGINCWLMENDQLSAWLSVDYGPRVLGISYQGSPNLFAEVPNAKIPNGEGKQYSLRGGHRLWYAPERPETTYLVDDQPPQVREMEEGLEFIQQVDRPTGIQKSWLIKLVPDQARVEIDHKLTNHGEGPFELAPWAVTMLRPGGVGLLPIQVDVDDDHGLWPNRQLLFWPYTDLQSEHLQITNQGLFICAELEEGALKVGAPNPLGYLAYSQEELLFVKESRYQKGMEYPDRGASHQIYCNPDLIELETLGPVTRLEPGETVGHSEIWTIYPEGKWPKEVSELFDIVDF